MLLLLHKPTEGLPWNSLLPGLADRLQIVVVFEGHFRHAPDLHAQAMIPSSL